MSQCAAVPCQAPGLDVRAAIYSENRNALIISVCGTSHRATSWQKDPRNRATDPAAGNLCDLTQLGLDMVIFMHDSELAMNAGLTNWPTKALVTSNDTRKSAG
jgi:hypothetical protein